MKRLTGWAALAVVSFGGALWDAGGQPERLFTTADQRAQRLFDDSRFGDAAQLYTEPRQQGVALYRAGDFEGALAAFNRQTTPEGRFNAGNALVMLGRYDEAMASYELTLVDRPAWREAAENRDLANRRKGRLAAAEDDHGGTGGMLEADEIRFDLKDPSKGSEVVLAQEEAEDALHAQWLRRVSHRPADFLRYKFAYQLEARDGEDVR